MEKRRRPAKVWVGVSVHANGGGGGRGRASNISRTQGVKNNEPRMLVEYIVARRIEAL